VLALFLAAIAMLVVGVDDGSFIEAMLLLAMAALLLACLRVIPAGGGKGFLPLYALGIPVCLFPSYLVRAGSFGAL
jgi:hypothetical protein